jgi:hypothetical protein
MRRPRRPAARTLCALGLLLVSASARAKSDRSADALLDSMVEALGGRAALAAVRSMAVEAVCSGPGGPFTTQVRSVRGAGTYFRQASADGITEIWSTPERTWSLAEDGSLRVHPDVVRSFVRGHEFHLLVLEVEQRFSGHRHAESDSVLGEPAHRIEMVDGEGFPAILWLGRETSLPLALEMNPEGAAGPVRVDFEDWASFGGVRLFRSFGLTEGSDREFRYDYVNVEINPALPGLLDAPADPERDRQAIEKILQRDREAHLQSDATLLTGHLADELVEVGDGAIRTRSRKEVVDFFTAMFHGATFHAWDDTTPPLIRISSDLSMAWVVRRVSADREVIQEGRPVRQRYTSAYTATYEKRAGRWWMTSVTSTFLPADADF